MGTCFESLKIGDPPQGGRSSFPFLPLGLHGKALEGGGRLCGHRQGSPSLPAGAAHPGLEASVSLVRNRVPLVLVLYHPFTRETHPCFPNLA